MDVMRLNHATGSRRDREYRARERRRQMEQYKTSDPVKASLAWVEDFKRQVAQACARARAGKTAGTGK